MAADKTKLDRLSACLDPYDAFTGNMASLLKKHRIELAGKFPVPSWLWPKPEPSDAPFVTAKNMAGFFDSGELLEITHRLQAFVKEKILSDIPVMLGVDHSATAGVISALSEKHTPGKLGVIVLDQHFDAIPLSVRLEGITGVGGKTRPVPVGFSDRFCCGNFWSYLIGAGIILPENMVFIGVADYPGREKGERNRYRETYLDYERRGCGFFQRERFEGEYQRELARFLTNKVKTPQVYISIDLDVGSYAGTHAARYMDRPGLSVRNILSVAGIVVNQCRRGRFTIAGLDIMEFNMHFLGIETADGVEDNTLGLMEKFIGTLI
jgi:arginase family enzyme